MNKHIVGRHFELTDAIKEHIETAIDSLAKYNLDIISTTTLLTAKGNSDKDGIAVEFVINLKDKNTIVITQRDKDAYAAIDIAIDRVKKSLRRHADKIKSHKIMSFKDMGDDAIAVTELDPEDIELVPMDLELHKPMDFDEAIIALKEEKRRQFIVFNDYDANMRVMYKRADGKFGLY